MRADDDNDLPRRPTHLQLRLVRRHCDRPVRVPVLQHPLSGRGRAIPLAVAPPMAADTMTTAGVKARALVASPGSDQPSYGSERALSDTMWNIRWP